MSSIINANLHLRLRIKKLSDKVFPYDKSQLVDLYDDLRNFALNGCTKKQYDRFVDCFDQLCTANQLRGLVKNKFAETIILLENQYICNSERRA